MDLKEIRRKNLTFMIEKLKDEGSYKTQEDMSIAMGFENGSYISQLKSGKRTIDDSKARDFEIFFKLKRYAFDVPIGEPDLNEGVMDGNILRPSLEHVVLNGYSDKKDNSDFVLIPEFDVKGACGLGYTNPDELIKGGLIFRESWLRKKGIPTTFGSAAVMEGDGESMHPTIDGKSKLLANLAIKTIDQVQTGRVYAFVANKELRIKRLFKNLKDGGLRIVSDNPNKEIYPDEYLKNEEINNIQIVAQIVWRGGDL